METINLNKLLTQLHKSGTKVLNGEGGRRDFALALADVKKVMKILPRKHKRKRKQTAEAGEGKNPKRSVGQ